ncbi:unnamed protein product [Ilex paraguariensis]|uniref:Nascent polypeptide-associated complex subunit alpha-like UBA domain-containing protein n=1 Tax=Ilex paraguariensis TaxID=185542 RepID=A0ABC8UGV8_9AQUA
MMKMICEAPPWTDSKKAPPAPKPSVEAKKTEDRPSELKKTPPMVAKNSTMLKEAIKGQHASIEANHSFPELPPKKVKELSLSKEKLETEVKLKIDGLAQAQRDVVDAWEVAKLAKDNLKELGIVCDT